MAFKWSPLPHHSYTLVKFTLYLWISHTSIDMVPSCLACCPVPPSVSSFEFNFWVIITHNRNTILICWAFPLGLQELLEPWTLYTTLNVLPAIPLGFVIKVFSDLRGRKILPNASFWLETCHTQKPVGLLLLIPTPSDSLAIFFLFN